ncbi:MAG TPA: Eco57I restriction-modification methylase domain-containing protein [Candidatus Binataceae bacterium]|nr:Eco57I restriction-modification methylase domain-containing protein [Candidatus Binataceae bacterium]
MTASVRQLKLFPSRAASSCPTASADRTGQAYAASCDDDHRKSHGLYLTPPVIAAFMADMIRPRDTMRLLDPAAGAGILLCAAVERLAQKPYPPRFIEISAYEIDSGLAKHLRDVLDQLTAWAASRGIQVRTTIRREDFILAEAAALHGKPVHRFDAVVANPPYFKIGKDDIRAVAARTVVHGQPNIYGLFMAVAAALLVPGGDLIFITPRSYASGPYFQKFRERFFSVVRPVQVHVFDSRRHTFSRDEVLQENVILHAVRDNNWFESGADHSFTISSSTSAHDLEDRVKWPAALCDVIDPVNLAGAFRLPASPEDEDILRRVDAWTGCLQDYGLQISTGPVVPFRAIEFLLERPTRSTVPLLWMHHVRAMDVHWPNGTRKPQYIVPSAGSRKLLVPNRNYVLLRRFSAKEEQRRLTASQLLSNAIDFPTVGLENHLNYVHRPGGNLTEDEAWGLAALYNSTLLDGYFRCINGNTQVSATELRAMPLPPLEAIVTLGRCVKRETQPLAVIDDLVLALTTEPAKKPYGTKKGKACRRSKKRRRS